MDGGLRKWEHLGRCLGASVRRANQRVQSWRTSPSRKRPSSPPFHLTSRALRRLCDALFLRSSHTWVVGIWNQLDGSTIFILTWSRSDVHVRHCFTRVRSTTRLRDPWQCLPATPSRSRYTPTLTTTRDISTSPPLRLLLAHHACSGPSFIASAAMSTPSPGVEGAAAQHAAADTDTEGTTDIPQRLMRGKHHRPGNSEGAG